jgi:hypothetical protein
MSLPLGAAAGGGKRTLSDTTLASRESRLVNVRDDELAGEPCEPINPELRYVYADDEHAEAHDTTVGLTMRRERNVIANCRHAR